LEWVDTGWVSDTLPLSASGGGLIDSETRSRPPTRLGPRRPRWNVTREEQSGDAW